MSKVLAGRYELFERIGEGGMSVVYKAKDKLLNRFVAIKILKPEFINDAKFIDSFRRESQAAASLSHPNIVNIYDVGREGNIHYIVMELIEGRALSDYIKEQGATVQKMGERIVVSKNQAKLLDIPVIQIENMAVIGNVQITTPALHMLMERGVDVSYLTYGGRFLGSTAAEASKNIFLRFEQYRFYLDDDRRRRETVHP